MILRESAKRLFFRLVGLLIEITLKGEWKMAAVVNKETCVGCGACVDACPCDAIKVEDGIAIVSDDCAGCGACADACPTESITVE